MCSFLCFSEGAEILTKIDGVGFLFCTALVNTLHGNFVQLSYWKNCSSTWLCSHSDKVALSLKTIDSAEVSCCQKYSCDFHSIEVVI
jgi:hypothetical protein